MGEASSSRQASTSPAVRWMRLGVRAGAWPAGGATEARSHQTKNSAITAEINPTPIVRRLDTIGLYQRKPFGRNWRRREIKESTCVFSKIVPDPLRPQLRTRRCIPDRVAGAPSARATLGSQPIYRDAVAMHRPVPGRANRRNHRRRAPTQPVLHGGGQWWRLAKLRLWTGMDSHLRWPTNGLGRCNRGRRLQSKHHLYWKRGRPTAARPFRWGRYLQDDRWGSVLASPWAPRWTADCRDLDRSARFKPGFCSGAWSSLWTQLRARSFSKRRRR